MGEVLHAFFTSTFAFVYDLFSHRRAKNLRIKILRARLLKDGYKWRSLKQLASAIGKAPEATTDLLIEMGARRSAGEKDVWTLAQKKPLKKNVKQRGVLGRIAVIVGWLVAAVSFVSAAVGLYVEVVPVVSVSPPTAGSSSQDPFTKPFVVNNEGSFSVYSLKATCGFPAGIEGLTKSGTTTLEPGKPAGADADFVFRTFSTDEFEPHEHKPFTCGTISNITFSGQLGSLSRCWVTILIEFRPIRFIPRSSSRKFSFEARPQEDGYFHWSEIPLRPG